MNYININIKIQTSSFCRFALLFLWAGLGPFALSASAQEAVVDGSVDSAADSSIASAVNELVAILAKSSSMQADVEQLTLDQGGNELQEVSARLIMQKPDHFYWRLLAPYEELMVTNGSKVWIYEPDLDQVTIRELETDLNRTPFLFLNGDAESLARSYAVSSSILPDSQRIRFVLLPLDPDSQLQRLSLIFLAEKLEEMQYETTLGQSISLYFSNLEVNMPIDVSIFEFDPPPGIEIIDTTEN